MRVFCSGRRREWGGWRGSDERWDRDPSRWLIMILLSFSLASIDSESYVVFVYLLLFSRLIPYNFDLLINGALFTWIIIVLRFIHLDSCFLSVLVAYILFQFESICVLFVNFIFVRNEGCFFTSDHPLYRIKYIRRLSWARTLVRKHKSTVRTFLKRSGSGLMEESYEFSFY